MISLNTELISAACNQLYNCLDWSPLPSYPLIYGGANQIFVYDHQNRQVKLTLTEHEGQITTLKFINNQKKLMILSGCTKGKLLLWECEKEDFFDIDSWKIKETLKLNDHILRINTYETKDSVCYFSCCFTNGKILFYSLENEQIKELACLEFGTNVMQALDFLEITVDCLLIVLGGLDFKLHFYYLDKTTENPVLIYINSIKAHENALNDISFSPMLNNFENTIFLATGARDSMLNIWQFSQFNENKSNSLNFSKKNHYILQIKNKKYEFELITALSSHTYHVTSLSWGQIGKELCVAAASLDSTISLWFPDTSTNAWVNRYTLGQLTKSNKDGFFFLAFKRPNYDKLIAYTLQGKFYLWNLTKEAGDIKFSADYCISGHFGKITDLRWNETGEYLATCSKDQTTRIFLKCQTNQIWQEVSRAQIHGYDMNSICWKQLPQTNGTYFDYLISGADEKQIRVFEPTAIFANWTNFLTNDKKRLFFTDKEEEQKCIIQEQEKLEYKVVTETGQVVLGLMNKQVKIEKEKFTTYYQTGEDEDEIEDKDNQEGFDLHTNIKFNFLIPPNEDQLILHTLWPEMNKFYGHSFEIKSIACQHTGSLIASSSKSLTQQHSTILIWDFENCKLIDKINQHKLTVTQLEFSMDDQYLGSVSRDRSFCLYKKTGNIEHPYELFYTNSTHTRIIWTLSFSKDTQYCLTGSRDKKLKIWKINEKDCELSVQQQFPLSVTAACFNNNPNIKQNLYLLAIGLENGSILLYNFDSESKQMVESFCLNKHLSPCQIISRLQFANSKQKENSNEINSKLAVGAYDGSIRIFLVKQTI